MKNNMPKKNPIVVDRIGFVDTMGPTRFMVIIPNNAAIRNNKGRVTTNKIWLRDNLDDDSIVVSIPGFL